ncbi:Tetratricopeptide repeat protein [Rubrivivax sp. A210]|nr:Tetratricopeptide repeat protein [Rubrivivax sp. A210]
MLLWGRPELHSNGAVLALAPERRYQLLALLALHEGKWVDRDHLATLLWPGHDPAAARRNLRKVLHQAHAVPGAQALESNDHALRWAVDTDLLAFERAVLALPGLPWARKPLQGPERRDWRARIDAGGLDGTLALRRGALLQGLVERADTALRDWLAAERERTDRAWHTVATSCLRIGSAPAACSRIAQRMLDVDALDETAVAALLTAHLAQGHSTQAQALYLIYAQRVRAELGVEPSSALRALMLAPAQPPQHTQPQYVRREVAVAAAAPALFIGRKTELTELCALLERPECRLVTLLGPGGAGKSRLARQALAPGAALSAPFGGGVLWVDLEDVSDTAAVPARLAQSLGLVGEAADDPVTRLCSALPATRTLWVLDNAEHLPELGPLLARLLSGAPALTMLVTSRRRLHAVDGWVLPLAGLAVPDDESRDLDAAASFDAVRLFDVRARLAQPGFQLARHLDAVLDIVGAVAGMPLAIELAAAWVRLLTPQQIAADLRHSIELLERDPASPVPLARPDHASLRMVLQRSWALLAPRECEALAALAVFSGGFTHNAARAVAHCPLPLLSALVDKSVVAVAEGGRFGLHPAVAAFANEGLAQDPPQAEALRLRHAEHFSRVLAALAPHAIGDPRPLVAGVEAEFANLCAAWRCAVQAGRVDWVATMVRALWAYFESRGRQREGITLLAPALALPADTAPARHAQSRLRHGLSMLHHRAGLAEQALQLARSGTVLAADGPDTEAWIGCVLGTGNCLWRDGAIDAAIERFEYAVALARKRGDAQCTAWAQGSLGVALIEAGRPQESESCLLNALAGSREVGDLYNAGWHLANLGRLGRSAGHRAGLDAARHWYAQALRHARDHDIAIIELHATAGMGHVLRQEGALVGARQHFDRAVQMSQRNGRLVLMESIEQGLAQLALNSGEWAEAHRLVQSLVRSAQQRNCASDLGEAVLIHAEWLQTARGDWAAARDALLCVLQMDGLAAPARQLAQASLAALPAALPEAAPGPSLADVVDRLLQV